MQVYNDYAWHESQVDALTIWYADVFFINRKPTLVIANPLTKFTFFVFRYSRRESTDFLQKFREKLSYTMTCAGIDPKKYLEQCDWLVEYEKSDKSASAHLSRTKMEYEYMIKSQHHNVDAADDEAFYNRMIADNLVSYHKKDFDRPSKRLYHEMLLRRWD